MITAESPIKYQRKEYNNDILLFLYMELLKPRLIEEKMLILLRQGRISKWFSGIGQEAISVGVVSALDKEEFILPMHRNLGVFTGRDIPLSKLFAQFQSKKSGFTKGRDRSFHFGTRDYNIVGMISHLGPQLGVADGIALADKISGNKKVTAVFSGDGGASEGDFHESLNVAAVWDLPVIFIIENNGYGLSTPSAEQFRCKQFIDKAIGYGIEGVQVDGNNILEVYDTVLNLAKSIRENPRPILLECITFRMRGHEEASGTKYIPGELFEIWGKKDPVANFENYLLEEKVIDRDKIEAIRKEIKFQINSELEIAFAEDKISADTETELNDVYAPTSSPLINPSGNSSDKRLIDAISDGLKQSMIQYPNLVLMGQDIADYGGVFKVTENFVKEFGKDRVRNTPLCESAIVGAGFGLSIKGFKAVVEMQFADFVSEAMTQIVNNLAKSHWRWGQNADVVVRMPTGAGVGAGPFHSQSNEAWFFHTPGLKVVYPTFPADAKGLLAASIADPNPVIFFEHKALYRSISEPVPDDYYTLELGKAKVIREGSDLTIVTYGLGVHWAIEIIGQMEEIKAEIVDLRTLLPLDKETIFESVKKTGKVLVLHEDTLTGGIGGEISALINEYCFENLDAPVKRLASIDTPVPFAASLEENFLPKNRLKKAIQELMDY